jgi:hypothetical protein
VTGAPARKAPGRQVIPRCPADADRKRGRVIENITRRVTENRASVEYLLTGIGMTVIECSGNKMTADDMAVVHR